jgi:hypothetical protein
MSDPWTVPEFLPSFWACFHENWAHKFGQCSYIGCRYWLHSVPTSGKLKLSLVKVLHKLAYVAYYLPFIVTLFSVNLLQCHFFMFFFAFIVIN